MLPQKTKLPPWGTIEHVKAQAKLELDEEREKYVEETVPLILRGLVSAQKAGYHGLSYQTCCTREDTVQLLQTRLEALGWATSRHWASYQCLGACPPDIDTHQGIVLLVGTAEYVNEHQQQSLGEALGIFLAIIVLCLLMFCMAYQAKTLFSDLPANTSSPSFSASYSLSLN